VTSNEQDNLLVFYYLSASEIRPDKTGDLWWGQTYKRGNTVYRMMLLML